MAGGNTGEMEKSDSKARNQRNTKAADSHQKEKDQQQPTATNNKEMAKVNTDIAPEVLIKHPLQNEWTLWFLEMDHSKTWEEMQNEITSFNTVEDFWSLYNHIKLASEIRSGSDYSIFKKNIRPMWEDEANKRGGRWVVVFRNRGHKRPPFELDNLWLDVILSLIGESFEHSNEVCGAVINARNKGDKVAVWTADGSNQSAVMEIGRKLKENLRLSPDVQLQYQLHKDICVNSNAKPIYQI